ncbi:MAG: di-heme enzyme [Chloracidobacterium sp.]|nr:di-heme enzyme [Chloracidobacterium sp.]
MKAQVYSKLAVLFVFVMFGLLFLGSNIFDSKAQTKTESYDWRLPKGFPVPRVADDNPMTAAKVELGRHLFYDKRLSINEKTSCATCHLQERAFTEDKKLSVGTTGEVHPRNSMSLANVAYAASFNWANPTVTLLERQPMVPIFGETPVEMGMSGKEELLLARLKAEPRYAKLFAEAYPETAGKLALNQVTQSLASFVRCLISGNSPYDQYKFEKKADAISVSAKRGEQLFFSERLECTDCHTGFNLSGASNYVGKAVEKTEFENNGIYNIDGKGGYPKDNTGLFEFTHAAEDMGKFKVPTLRNIELTAPYMHDGSIATLEDVIEHYKAGGRTIKDGPNKGNGSENPNKSSFVRGFNLSGAEKADLMAFLKSLTDNQFITDPRFSDPWK